MRCHFWKKSPAHFQRNSNHVLVLASLTFLLTYSVNLRFQSKYRKIRTRNNSIFRHFSRNEMFLFTPQHFIIVAQIRMIFMVMSETFHGNICFHCIFLRLATFDFNFWLRECVRSFNRKALTRLLMWLIKTYFLARKNNSAES